MSLSAGWFVTGTDTGVGKTRAAVSLLRGLTGSGRQAVGMKPAATGGLLRAGRLVNEDALALLAASSVSLPYELVNPYVYREPVSPHVAAAAAGETITFGPIMDAFHELCERAPYVVVEGAGGWLVPLNGHQTMEDLARLMHLPVVLVVGMRLGCINHALLSHRAIRGAGAPWAGWIANHIDPLWRDAASSLATLTAALGPPLAVIPYGDPAQPLESASFLGK